MSFMDLPPTFLQTFLIVSLPLMGLVYALLGGLKLSLAERLSLDEGKVGSLVAGFGMMVGPTILLCGFLTDSIGRKAVFLPGAGLVVAAIVVLASARDFKRALIGVLLLGTGWSATINVANVVVYDAIDETRRTAWFLFTDCIFGLGAFVTPIVLAFLFRRAGYQGALWVLAAASAVPIILGIFAQMGGGGAGTSEVGLGTLLSGRVFWLTCLAFLFYVPLESSVAGWATTLVMRHVPEGSSPESTRRLASLALSGFWLGFTGSRFLMAVQMKEEWKSGLFTALSIATLALMLGIVFLRGRYTAAALVLVAGLVFGPIFPILIRTMMGSVPQALQGRAVGFFFFFGSIGWTFIPGLIGNVANRTNDIQRGFLVATVSSAIFVAFVLFGGFV